MKSIKKFFQVIKIFLKSVLFWFLLGLFTVFYSTYSLVFFPFYLLVILVADLMLVLSPRYEDEDVSYFGLVFYDIKDYLSRITRLFIGEHV